MTEGDHQTGDTIVQAKSLLKSIRTFEFIVLLKFWDSLLSQINRVNLALQDKKLDIARAAKMIKGLLSQLIIYRETFFTTILQSSIVTAEQLQVTPDFQDTRKRPKKMMPGEKAKDESPSISAQTHFKAGLNQVLEVNKVADDFAFLSGQAIVNTSVTELTKIAADLAIKYPDDLDPHEFSSEIESFKFQATTLMSEATDMNHLNVLEKIFDLSLEDVYPNITTALRIFICMPVTTATFSSGAADLTKDQCNKTVDIFEDVSSPEVNSLNVGRPLTCWYRFRTLKGAPRDFVLRLRFKKFKVGTLLNATHCEGGYLQIVDGNAKTDVSNRREPGMFCGEAEQPQTFISETNYVKVLFHTDNFTDQTYFTFDSRAEQQTEVYLRYGQHPELYPNRRGEVVQGSYCEREYRDCRLQTCYVQSPAYPGLYPRALNCRYKLHTRQPYIKLYLQNEQFAVDGQRCENVMTCPIRPIGSGKEHCPYDWLAVYDGRDEHSPLIGKFCGLGKFPFSIIGTSQYMYVEFVTSPAGPLLNTGFHFNVGNWPGHVETAGIKHGICDWLLSSDSLKDSSASEGIFLSIAHWYPPNTSCSYHIKGRIGEIVRLYFPRLKKGEYRNYLPKFGEPLQNVTVPVGREAVLQCVVDNLQTYKIAWLRVDTQTILTIQNHVITKNNRMSITHAEKRAWILRIRDVKEADKGWYMCQINTDPMKSQVGYLDVVGEYDKLN
ncbi:uncharacterized protein LOC120770697 [Bactrocera tryoni]|uniref:uncharacterized protein LOC120770697 n=1 Tax=Bactrocera tryoni TaxID=59916 RepID=UPI001A9579AE|nr:uncharacterized protein LOC120770697 [Bactrocera tryoni]